MAAEDSDLADRVFVTDDATLADRVYVVNISEFVGEAGPQGEPGETGAAGATGATGATGASGPSNVIAESSGPTSLTVGAILDKERFVRSGSTVVGVFERTIAQSGDVTEAVSTSNVDIPGLTVTLPRAGTYHFSILTPWTALDGTSRTMEIGVAYSGSITQLALWALMGTPGGVATYRQQTVSGTLCSLAAQTGTANHWMLTGMIKVTTSGTFKVQFRRTAASITHLNGVMRVIEAVA